MDSSLSSLSSSPPQTGSSPIPNLRRLPPAELLLALPGLFAHPPGHKLHITSLALSLHAARQCLELDALLPLQEVRAHAVIAEIGIRVVEAGYSHLKEHEWASGIEQHVTHSLSRGSILAHKHPSLRFYALHLSLLQAHYTHTQGNSKLARKLLTRMISTAQPTDPAHFAYQAYLYIISHHLNPTGGRSSSVDIESALVQADELRKRADARCHTQVKTLSLLIRICILVSAGRWGELRTALEQAESMLNLSFPAPPSQPTSSQAPNSSSQYLTQSIQQPSYSQTPSESTQPSPAASSSKPIVPHLSTPFDAAMTLHLLMLSILFHSHAGSADASSARLDILHALLDSGALDQFTDGTVPVPIPNEQPLYITVPHPRLLFLYAYLVSALAKKDVMGRNPKRKVFAVEGLKTWEGEHERDVHYPAWAGFADADEIEQRIARVKADLLCDLVSIAIMRSEFDEADSHLANLIAYTRTMHIWPSYSARIALLHAHLAHALCNPARAIRCYTLAASLSLPDSEVHAAALAGISVLEFARAFDAGSVPDEATRLRAKEAVRACRANGAALDAISGVLEAMLSSSITLSKSFLRAALDKTGAARDNHLRGPVLALVSAHYVHTIGERAGTMLRSLRQIAAGLGPAVVKGQSTELGGEEKVGNAVLGLWVGEQYHEYYKRAGDEVNAGRQAGANARLSRAVERLKERGRALDSDVLSSGLPNETGSQESTGSTEGMP